MQYEMTLNLNMEERKHIRRCKNQMKRGILFFSNLIMICSIIFGIGYINHLQNIINDTQKELTSANKTIQTFIATTSDNENQINSLKEALNQAASDAAELKELRSRRELYDKYSYVLSYNGQRTDMTYDQLKYGEDLMKSKNIDPNLLFGVVMTESKATEKAQNKCSSARGYCQVIESTAKSIYERYLHKGIYKHSMAFDGYTNMEIGAELIAINMEKYNGDTQKVIQRYRGLDDPAYYASVDAYVNRGGTNLRRIAHDYKNQ